MCPPRRAAPCALLTLTLAGCGGSSGSSRSAPDVASKPPPEILADMRSALAGVQSYHIAGTVTEKQGRTRIVADVSAPDSLRLRLQQGAKTAQVLATGSETYLRANRAFWLGEGGVSDPRVLKVLSDRWVKAPRDSEGGLRELVSPFTPRNLGHCLSAETGTVVKRGTRRFADQRVVVLTDKGDRPGTSPGDLYVAASGATLPLRIVQTGRQRPGGRHDPRCGGSDSTTTAADVRLSRFDEPVQINAPSDVLDLASLAGGGSAA